MKRLAQSFALPSLGVGHSHPQLMDAKGQAFSAAFATLHLERGTTDDRVHHG